MDELLSMGFSEELASQALAATGGKCTIKATTWLLDEAERRSSYSSSSTCPKHLQGKVKRFFSSPSTPLHKTSLSEGEELARDYGNENGKNTAMNDTAIFLQTKKGGGHESEIKGGNSSSMRDGALHYIEAAEESKMPVFSNSVANVKNLQCEGSVPIASHASFLPPSPKRRVGELPSAQAKQSPVPLKRMAKAPLADRIRPLTVNEIVGQDHLLGSGCILRSLLDNDTLTSIILWGPPGTGKTSLARTISRSISCRYVSTSAVNSGVKEVREILEEAKRLKKMGQRTLLFMDEVHRFNKAQQDAFLPYIEAGHVLFIGATTENPSFELNAALLSRCRVLTLNKLQALDIKYLLTKALSCNERGVMAAFVDDPFVSEIKAEDQALEFLAEAADGDARVALNALDVAATSSVSKMKQRSLSILEEGSQTMHISVGDVSTALQRSHVLYDKKGEEHYNLISALHKSMRGGDADAALYWLARMLQGGEEPLYIARRLIRFASEDVGLADPQALVLAVACYQACHFVGMPECDVNLGQCVAYLSLAPKSIALYQAVSAVRQAVRETEQNEPVPLHLRNASTRLMKELGYGQGYIYPPTNTGQVEQEYLPPSLRGSKFLQWP